MNQEFIPLNLRSRRSPRNSRARGLSPTIKNFQMLKEAFLTAIDSLIKTGYFIEDFGAFKRYSYSEEFLGGGTLGPTEEIKDEIYQQSRSNKFWPFTPHSLNIECSCEEDIFEACELGFLYVSKPIGDDIFDRDKGKADYCTKVNDFLKEYGEKEGYEINTNGKVTLRLEPEIQRMCHQDFSSPWDKEVTGETESAVSKVLDRNSNIQSWKDASIQLASVLEFLRKNGSSVLSDADEGSLRKLANKYALRHNNEDQIRNYDSLAGYQYMFRVKLAAIIYILAEVRAKR